MKELIKQIEEQLNHINHWFDYVYDLSLNNEAIYQKELLAFKSHSDKVVYLIELLKKEIK